MTIIMYQFQHKHVLPVTNKQHKTCHTLAFFNTSYISAVVSSHTYLDYNIIVLSNAMDGDTWNILYFGKHDLLAL